jgi:hypothetical protein
MTINYTWNFNPLEAYPTSSGEDNVVFLVHWQLYGSTGSYQSSVIGTQPVSYETSSVFTPFNDLTYDMVYNWMTASMGLDQMTQYEASVAQNIENQINPPVLIETAPWLVTTTTSTTTTTTTEEPTTSTTTTTTTEV